MVTKVVELVLERRLHIMVTVSKTQCGFMGEKGTSDVVWMSCRECMSIIYIYKYWHIIVDMLNSVVPFCNSCILTTFCSVLLNDWADC